MIPELEPRRYPASGYGLRADELGQQMMMGGIAAASLALIVVLLILAGFVIAAVLSIVAAIVIVILLQLMAWETAPTYGQAYKASVFGIFGFVAWVFVIHHVLPVHEYPWDPEASFLSHHQLLAHVQQDHWSLWPILPTLLVRFGPGLLICAWLLQRNLRLALAGPLGYLKAVVVSLIAVLLSSYVVAILGVRFVQRIVRPEHTLEIFLRQVPGSVVALAVFSVVGGIFAALVIYLATRLPRRSFPFPTRRRFYSTAVIGLFLYFGINTLVLFLYQDVKHLDAALERMFASGDPLGTLFGDSTLFANVRFWDYFVWQLPGLIVASWVMATRIRGPFEGPHGYLKACLVGGVAWPGALVGMIGVFVALVYVVR